MYDPADRTFTLVITRFQSYRAHGLRLENDYEEFKATNPER